MNEKILVVDDEESIRNQCARVSKKEGYDVTVASNGSNALKLLQAQHFDIVISDLLMPGSIDGEQLLHEIRKNYPKIDMIIITAHPSLESAIAALKDGVYDYLIKPFSPDELCAVVKRCLEKRQLKEDLERTCRENQALNDSREMFMQLLVHDMKNPLSGILGNAKILLMDPLDQEQRETLDDILRSSERLHQMVINLLDIGKMEDGKFQPECKSVQVAELFDEIQKLMGYQMDQKRIKFSTEIEPENLAVRVDNELMIRVFQNLLDNSLQYTPEEGQIKLSAKKGEEIPVVFRVKDNGQSVSDKYKETIFTRYGCLTRGGERTNRGMGLYFCKLAVEANAGTIELDDVKEGTAFLIKLPAKSDRRIIRQQSLMAV